MTTEQIKAILSNAKEILTSLNAHPDYKAMEKDDFVTPNNLTLLNAIQVLQEIHQEITDTEWGRSSFFE